MFHLAAYSTEQTNDTTVNLQALVDGRLNVNGTAFRLGMPMDIRSVLLAGADVIRGRILTPRLRPISEPYIVPVHTALLPTVDTRIMDLRNNPLRVDASEDIDIESTVDGAAPARVTAALWLYQQFTPAPSGEIITLRMTSTTTAVPFAWTQLTVTNDFQLPQGRYAVVGGSYFAINAIAFRVLFEGQFLTPGGIGSTIAVQRPWAAQLNGGLGKWGEFDTVTIPNISILNGAADVDHTIYLQVVRVR